ncbi:hypothetical protein [Nocardioides sp.]|uniref:hypothetical protein n=1 Tax=Nocardioides sp. TaxID=35761 RepID=UPI002BE8E093|nr:hypothetical protein [Nocardioides sp.]HSX66917.1 hypothetical protein [Nocardioides sp.]
MSTNLKPMSQQRHDAIRTMLVDHVDTESIRRPAPRPAASWRRPTLIGVAAASVVTAAVATTLVVADPSAPPSYASWTAAPDSSVDDEEARTEWRSRCTDLGTGGIGFVGVPVPDWTPRDVLVDRRGDFVFCVDIALGSGTEEEPFIGLAGIRADEGSDALNTMHGVVHDRPVERPSTEEVLVVGMSEVEPDPDPSIRQLSVAQVYGLVGSAVTGVDVHLANGTTVTASVANGIFGAWWPTEEGAIDGATLTVHIGDREVTVAPTSPFS